MARKKTGALIVIQQDMDLAIYEHTGEMFNADVNARLIENIFFKNSPLHDGAMIIADNRIKGGRLYLAGRPERYPSQGLWDCAIVPVWGCHWRQMRWLLLSRRREERSPWPIKVS